MAVLSTLAQLEEVQTAITAVLAGAQSYTLHGRTVAKANLADLERRETTFLARYNRETNGKGPRVRNAVLG